MSFPTDKTALIDLVKTKSCTDVKDIMVATTYGQLLDLFFQFAGLWDCDLVYLGQVLDLFDDAVLLANGIYYNKTAASIDNPKVLVASNYTDVNINAGGPYSQVEVLKGCAITNINVTNSTDIRSLSISGGSTVALLSVEEDSEVELLLIKSCNGANSTLTKIVEGSKINDFGIDQNSIFGGYICDTSLT